VGFWIGECEHGLCETSCTGNGVAGGIMAWGDDVQKEI